ncbi:MAG: tetratricopeptide repeat protein [Bacteroidota bacterium]
MKQLNSFIENKYTRAAFFLIVSVFIFYPAFQSDFIPWDDKEYIVENKDIQSLSFKNIGSIFSNSYIGNYHPITMMSFAFDYFFFGEKATGYHLHNLLLHLLNGILVYLLLKNIFKNPISSFIGSVLFLIHPVQSETVMWIAERKNLLFVFYFLLSLLNYWKFLESNQKKYYWFTLVFFILSCLSKATAVTLPLVLVLIDFFKEKKLISKFQINKIPFFLISLVLGLLAIHFQKKDGFINNEHDFGILQNSLFASYALMIYIGKFLFPMQLSTYYPYPIADNILVWISTGFSLLTLASLYLFWKKNYRLFVFGSLFFLINIFPMLQWIPFGKVLVAERYNYLPILGLIVFIIFLAEWILKRKPKLKPVFFAIVPLMLLWFGSSAFTRNKTWKNSIVFYNDILKKFPESEIILNSLGAEYMIAGDYVEAHELYQKAKNINPRNYSIYYNEGLTWLKQGETEKAFQSFSECLDITPYHKAYFARASILEQTGQYKKAIDDLDAVINSKPEFAKAYHLRGLCKEKSGRLDEARADYQSAVELDPKEALFHLNLGIAIAKKGDTEKAIRAFDTAIELKPDYAQAYFSRAIAKYNSKENPCEDLKSATKLGLREAEDAAIRICR